MNGNALSKNCLFYIGQELFILLLTSCAKKSIMPLHLCNESAVPPVRMSYGGVMTYDNFITEVHRLIENRLPATAEAHIRRIQKNNNKFFDGLVISDSCSNVSPTIYLEGYYQEYYKKGVSVDEIADLVFAQYEEARLSEPIDVSFFSDFENLKDRIIFRVVNRERNENLLERIPHIDYLDLAVTFLCLLSMGEASDSTILIYNSHLELWGVDTDTLFSLAKKNTPRLFAWELASMHDILSEMAMPQEDLIPSPEDLAFPMYVLTNRIRLHGASCILYEDLLSSLSGKLKDDFYIIPSSIHEVLLVPHTAVGERKDLDTLVCEVNATQVPEEEILSDHAYLYSRKENAILY